MNCKYAQEHQRKVTSNFAKKSQDSAR